MKPSRDEDQGYTKTFYIQTMIELDDFIRKYKYNCNLFIALSTYKDKLGTKEHAHARKAMFLDFDKKDYPQYESIQDFTSHIKRIMPYLFNHCVISSGNGYHFYIATQKTIDIARAVRINKNLAKILGADLKAVSPTQLVRLPTSLNLKNEKKPVAIVSNNFGSAQFKPYTLNKLEQIISYVKHANEIKKEIEPLAAVEYSKTSSYFCIRKMLSEGSKKGQRNFCLGRIVKFLKDIEGYRQDQAFNVIVEWNRKCNPPKALEELKMDFDSYWNSEYKLLGCNLSNQSDQSTLNKYCDKYNCTSISRKYNGSSIKTAELKIDNHLLQNSNFQKLRGNHYLILSVLHIHSNGLSLEKLKEEITNPNTRKCCLSKNTFKTVLNDLLDKYISCNRFGIYQLIDVANFGLGYTRYYYSATILLINGIITQQEYLVYLCLVRNLQQNKDVSYHTLAADTGIDRSNLSRYINNLFKSKILLIEKGYNEKGVLYNCYTLVA